MSETLGEERKWVHYGLTSTDVVDTALSFVVKQANEIIEKDLERFIEVLANKAKNYKYTLMMGAHMVSMLNRLLSVLKWHFGIQK